MPQKSSLAKHYFKYLRKSTVEYNGVRRFMLPGCLNFFQNIDGKCEHNIKAAKPIMLEWDDKADGKAPKIQKEQPVDEEEKQEEVEADGEQARGEENAEGEEDDVTRMDTEDYIAWEMF